ncbi:uncharacterized protein [Nicotiana sylvestris]|uniref:uncharacterized protein n=1 Tax=Nicotiana sylvestris TaxID=4096 RepID=UPI00388C4212
MIEAVDALLRDIMDIDTMFGEIWNKLEKLYLSENMRARTDHSFCEYLLRIGNGTKRTNCEDKIEIPDSFVIPFTIEAESLDALFSVTYPDLHAFSPNSSMITSDETIEQSDQSQFEDFLHSLDPHGLPPYKLTLKENCPVILLRNLNPSEGLCNDTRLTCCDFRTHVISAKIESGDFKNTHVFIPRIPLLTSQDEKIPLQFKRTQFLLCLCFAMTINKAQGQILDFVGIYLREPVFSHGQLYVALSRAKSSNCVKILIRPSATDSNDNHSTYNMVYDEIIQKSFS